MLFFPVSGFIPGFLVPALMGFVGKSTRDDWRLIFAIAVGVIIVNGVLYLLLVDTKVQDFNKESSNFTNNECLNLMLTSLVVARMHHCHKRKRVM